METIFDFTGNKEILDKYLRGTSKEEYLKYNSKNNNLIDLYDYFRSINDMEKANYYLNKISDIELINEILQKDVIGKNDRTK